VRVSKLKNASETVHPALRTALTATEIQMTAFATLFFAPSLDAKLIAAGLGTELSLILSALIVAVAATFVTILIISIVSRHIAIKIMNLIFHQYLNTNH
jgi:hypothetical protein